VGISDYPYIQGRGPCAQSQWYCFDNVYASYKSNLLQGLTLAGNKTYHPAVKSLIIMNEPDLKVYPMPLRCRALASAFEPSCRQRRISM